MVDLLAINPLYLVLYISIFIIIIAAIGLAVIYLKSRGKRKNDIAKIRCIIDYMKKGFKAGYTAESMVSYLMLNGWSLLDCNRALKALKRHSV